MNVFPPYILLSPGIHERNLEGVHSDDAASPGSGHATFTNRHLHTEEILRIELVAPPSRRLQREEKPCFFEGINIFHGHTPILKCLAGVGSQQRMQRLHSLQHSGPFVSDAERFSIYRYVHGSSPIICISVLDYPLRITAHPLYGGKRLIQIGIRCFRSLPNNPYCALASHSTWGGK